MKTIPSFSFVRAQSGSPQFPKIWLASLADTGRFFRSAQGKILFLAQTSPDEFISLGRADELRAVIEDGSVLVLSGDAPNADDWKALWHATSDHRWRLPSAANRFVPAQVRP